MPYLSATSIFVVAPAKLFKISGRKHTRIVPRLESVALICFVHGEHRQGEHRVFAAHGCSHFFSRVGGERLAQQCALALRAGVSGQTDGRRAHGVAEVACDPASLQLVSKGSRGQDGTLLVVDRGAKDGQQVRHLLDCHRGHATGRFSQVSKLRPRSEGIECQTCSSDTSDHRETSAGMSAITRTCPS